MKNSDLKEKLFNLNIKNIKINNTCRENLKNIKTQIYGNVLDAIEMGNWNIPFKNHEYTELKEYLETSCFHDFFNLDKTIKIEIEKFDFGN